jgi:hypothetical protein
LRLKFRWQGVNFLDANIDRKREDKEGLIFIPIFSPTIIANYYLTKTTPMIPKLFKFNTSLLLISLIIFHVKSKIINFTRRNQRTQDTSVLKILNNLKQKNEQIPFVDKLVKEAELLLWDKAILYKSTRQINFNAKCWTKSNNIIANDIMSKLNNGELKYLSPLDFTIFPLYHPENCSTCTNGIGPSTILLPTNQ